MMRRALGGISKISGKRARAFTFTEVLISMIIIAILGGIAAVALWLFFNSFSQMDDLSSAEWELNHAVQRLNQDFLLIGLGMPNNMMGEGSFARAFRGSNPAPTVASFGPPDGTADGDPAWAWGSPVTVSAPTLPANQNIPVPVPNVANVFTGPQLFYAWGVPTGVRASIVNMGLGETSAGNNLELQLMQRQVSPTELRPGGAFLGDFRWDGRHIGLQATNAAGSGDNLRSWLLLPTLRLPMRATTLTNTELNVVIVPNDAGPPDTDTVRSSMERPFTELLDDIHLIQAARLYLHPDRELRRVFLTTPGNQPEEVLARNVVGLLFVHNRASRLLTMHIAARGNERNPPGWRLNRDLLHPDLSAQITAEDALFRIVVKRLTWRIRN